MAISLDSVSVGYGDTIVLRGVSLEFREGSFTFLEGASGAGKSTFLRLLRMDLLPAEGRLRLFGEDVMAAGRDDRAALRRSLGLVFQDFRLVPWLSALENVALPLRLGDEAGGVADDYASELLEWVGLGEKCGEYPERLSGGERQCVAIARAVITRPRFLLADEPTGSVDGETARKLMHLFYSLCEGGTGVLVATHDAALAGDGCDRLLIEDGQVKRQ